MSYNYNNINFLCIVWHDNEQPSKQRVNEIWSKAHESLLEMLNSSDPDEMSGRLQQFNELMTEYAQAAKFVNSREDIFG